MKVWKSPAQQNEIGEGQPHLTITAVRQTKQLNFCKENIKLTHANTRTSTCTRITFIFMDHFWKHNLQSELIYMCIYIYYICR